jgi:hypothetical protein
LFLQEVHEELDMPVLKRGNVNEFLQAIWDML